MILEGPESKPFSKNAPKYLVIMLHGYGSNGDNMIDLATSFERSLPDAHFLAPNAPNTLENGGYGGYQWFSLASRAEDYMIEGIKNASITLNSYIDEQLTRFNLTPDKLILLGFSQGAMLSIYIALRKEQQIAGVVAYSGALLGARFLDQELKSKPETLIVHGNMDDVVDYESLTIAASILKKYQVPVKTLTCHGLAHSINIEGIREATSFMKNNLLTASI